MKTKEEYKKYKREYMRKKRKEGRYKYKPTPTQKKEQEEPKECEIDYSEIMQDEYMIELATRMGVELQNKLFKKTR